MASAHWTLLLKHRKRCALTQDEVAFLLGGVCGTKVGRYERAERTPPLTTAIALAVVLDAPVHDLFAGIYTDVSEDIKSRARLLLRDLETENCAQAKRRHLRALIAAL